MASGEIVTRVVIPKFDKKKRQTGIQPSLKKAADWNSAQSAEVVNPEI